MKTRKSVRYVKSHGVVINVSIIPAWWFVGYPSRVHFALHEPLTVENRGRPCLNKFHSHSVDPSVALTTNMNSSKFSDRGISDEGQWKHGDHEVGFQCQPKIHCWFGVYLNFLSTVALVTAIGNR